MTTPAEAQIKLYWFILLLAFSTHWSWAATTQALIDRGYQYLEQDKLDAAQASFQQAMEQAQSKKQTALRVEAGMGLAEVHHYRGAYPKAKDQLELCVQWADSDRPARQRAQFKLAELYFLEGELRRVRQLIEAIELGAKPQEDQLILAQAYNLLAKTWSQQNRLEKANTYLKKGKDLALQLKDKTLAIELLTQLATNYKNQDAALLQAQQLLETLIDLRRAEKDSLQLITDYQELADLLQKTGDFPKAQAQRLTALRYAQHLRDSLQQMELLYDLGLRYVEQQQLETAERYFQRALNLAELKKNTFKTAEIERQLGLIQAQQQQTLSAHNWFRRALFHFRAIGNDLELGRTLTLFHRADSLRRALPFFAAALERKVSNQEILGQLDIRIEMSQIELQLGNSQAALGHLNPALALAEQSNSRQQWLQVLHLLAQAHAQRGAYPLAYRYAERYQSLKDSLFNLEQSRIISEMNARFDNAALKDSLQMAEIDRNRAELRQKNLLNYVLLAALLAGGLITYLLFRNYQTAQQKRLQAQQLLALEKQREAEQLRSMFAGEEQERKRIAQELHDGLGTLLATIKMQFNAVQNQRPDIEGVQSYQKADHLLDEACTEVRKISYNLMPAILQQYGLEYALQDLCADIDRSGALEVSFIPFGLDQPFEDQLAISAYRIVQELVKNALRHAQASTLIVQVSAEDGQLSIVVEDDGRGFDVSEKIKHPGIGLQSIQSRLTLLNGRMDIEAQAGAGSTFTIEIPLNS